jgi:hormone-sensitive lipase
MTEYHHEGHYSLGTKTLNYDADDIETTDLKDLLIPVIQILKSQAVNFLENLSQCPEESESITDIIHLMHVADILQRHFEFTLALLQTDSEEEIEPLKQKFEAIRSQYEGIRSKEDITTVPTKYVVILFHDKLVVELTRILKKCFKKSWTTGKIQLVKDHDNIAQVKILSGRFEVAVQHFAQIVCFSKDDIFALPKSSPIWQELYKSTTFKEILTEKEAQDSFRSFELTNYIGHVIVKNQQEYGGLLNVKGALNVLKEIIYYGSHQRKAETQTLLRLINPKMEGAFDVWNLPEIPFVALTLSFNYPIIGYDELIHLPRLFPRITKQVILKEYEDKTFNKICPMEDSQVSAPYLASTRDEVLEEIFKPADHKIPVRILSNDQLELKESTGNTVKGMIRKVARVLTGHEVTPPPGENVDTAIVIHIHGGGFVSMTSQTHRIYLNRWAKNLKMIHFSIDYRLAPQSRYPDALDDVWQAYLWIINYSETVLGIKNKKVILVGDSAGGNLSLALSLRLIRAGLQPPYGCLLLYPALLIDSGAISPSSFASLDETVLPTSLLRLCAKAYIGEGEEFRPSEDPFISPLVASDELLEKLPPVRLVVGSKDPLHDDSWRFLARLKKLNKDAKLVVHEHIRHAYLCHQDLKNYHLFMEEACDLIKELVELKP